MVKCVVCGKTVRKNFFSPNVHPDCWKMKVVDKQKQGTLDDIFNIQPKEIEKKEKENGKEKD